MKAYCLRVYARMHITMTLISASGSPPPPDRFLRLMRWIERRYHLA